jgi:hypothetical protein
MTFDNDPDETTEIRHRQTEDAKAALSHALDETDRTEAVVAESIGWVATIRAIREANHLTQKWRSILQGYGQGAA